MEDFWLLDTMTMLGVYEEKQGWYGWNCIYDRKSDKKMRKQKQRIGLLGNCKQYEKIAMYVSVKGSC